MSTKIPEEMVHPSPSLAIAPPTHSELSINKLRISIPETEVVNIGITAITFLS